ncbi:MAG: hypothetical protein KDA32_03855, partial [Phycisphaerales bacterium]|nr:hypothetical protein [Phycisphaerales bacterium]
MNRNITVFGLVTLGVIALLASGCESKPASSAGTASSGSGSSPANNTSTPAPPTVELPEGLFV